MAHTCADIELGLFRRETEPPGYPQFTAFIASHPSLLLCRRFSQLRARLLLLKQDRVAQLEARLRKLDSEEANPLFLGSRRLDKNDERLAVLAEISEAMKDLDSYVENLRRAIIADPAPPRSVGNLRRWIAGRVCIARAETAFLDHEDDLFSIEGVEDTTTAWLERTVEDVCVWFKPRTPSQMVYLFGSSVRACVRIIVAVLVTVLLLTPVVICNFVSTVSSRLLIVTLATTTFTAVLSTLTRASVVELIVAGATYTTVMVVFISSTGE